MSIVSLSRSRRAFIAFGIPAGREAGPTRSMDPPSPTRGPPSRTCARGSRWRDLGRAGPQDESRQVTVLQSLLRPSPPVPAERQTLLVPAEGRAVFIAEFCWITRDAALSSGGGLLPFKQRHRFHHALNAFHHHLSLLVEPFFCENVRNRDIHAVIRWLAVLNKPERFIQQRR